MKKLYTLLFLLPFVAAIGQVEGTWKIAPIPDAIGVGPDFGNITWWSNSLQDLTTRACYFDDTYVFHEDGTFNNVLDDETWIEEWQGGDPPLCDTPVPPHDGSNAATWTFDGEAGTVTLDGIGAYLGLAKVFNEGELTDPGDAPESITYLAVFSADGDTMTIDISIATGWWRYIMVKVVNNAIFETSDHQIAVYPNPVSDVLYLENAKDFVDVSVYSIRGQLIYRSDQVGNSINVKNFPAGIYILRANSIEGKQFQARFTVQ